MKRLFQWRLFTIAGSVTIFFCIVGTLLHNFLEDYPVSSSNKHYSVGDIEEIHFKDVTVPVILWWTPFTNEKALFRKCGNVECFFTEDRKFLHHNHIKTIMFYGSKFDALDLPLPRNGLNIYWALFHEESPKNVPMLSHEPALNLFNFTATFSRLSSFPLTLQYLSNVEELTSHKFFVSLQKKNTLLQDIAPVLYIHSDCNTPLERDSYVLELMKHIRVDSYGSCLQNRKLPESLADPMENLDSEEFYHFVAKYKFTLAFENSACNDYITEKLWRPLVVGSIPIYMGSPTVQDWLPNHKSAILASNYESPKMLAKLLHQVNRDDQLYLSFLSHKLKTGNEKITNLKLVSTLSNRLWGIGDDFEKGNMVEHFECFICKKSHEENRIPGRFVANISHYDCPVPVSPLTQKVNVSNWWVDQWTMGQCEAEALNFFVNSNITDYSQDDFFNKVKALLLSDKC